MLGPNIPTGLAEFHSVADLMKQGHTLEEAAKLTKQRAKREQDAKHEPQNAYSRVYRQVIKRW